MKKLLILFVFLSINYFSYSQEFEKSNSAPVEYDDSFIDKASNVLRVKFDEHFVSKQEDIKDIAIDYLKEYQSQYGIRDVLDEMFITNTFKSPMGYYVYFKQMFNKIPISATNFTVFLDKDKTVRYVLNEFRYFEKHSEIPSKPTIDAKEALQIARNHLKIEGDIIGEPTSELVYFESTDKGLKLAWKIEMMALKPQGDWQFFINASDKHIIQVKDITENYDHIWGAYVYDPNPLVTARESYGGWYTHNNGTTNQYLDDELQMVTLYDMQTASPLYNFAFLSGTYACVKEIEPPNTTIPVVLFNSVPYWTRDQEEFLALMCYYHVTKSGRRVAELGYMTSGLNGLKIDPYSSLPHSTSALAYYRPAQNYIAMGGCGDDRPASAEDADIIWHEYAHALQTHLGATGYMAYTEETKAIQEGSSDYWAASHKKSISNYKWEIGALWASGRSGRFIYSNGHRYPTTYNILGENQRGAVWSTALLDIWNLLGKDITDKLFLETHLRWGLSPTMRYAARCFLNSSQYVDDGKYYCTIKSVFEKRGLFVPLTSVTASNIVYNTDKTIAADNFDIKNTIKVASGATLTIVTCGNFTLNDKIQLDPGTSLIIRASSVSMEPGWVIPTGAYFSIQHN